AVAAREAQVAATPAGEAREIAQIIGLAVRHFDAHGEGDCPVCGKRLALLPSWRARAEQRILELTARAAEADAVAREAVTAAQRVARLTSGPPRGLAGAAGRPGPG